VDACCTDGFPTPSNNLVPKLTLTHSFQPSFSSRQSFFRVRRRDRLGNTRAATCPPPTKSHEKLPKFHKVVSVADARHDFLLTCSISKKKVGRDGLPIVGSRPFVDDTYVCARRSFDTEEHAKRDSTAAPMGCSVHKTCPMPRSRNESAQ
jgi:hypothetical protein